MPISFVKMVNLVSCRNAEKYGAEPRRLSCDLPSVWKKRGGKGGPPCCRQVAVQSCVISPCWATLYALIHLPSKEQQWGWWGQKVSHLCCSPRASLLTGQENQGRVGAPRPPPHVVRNLNCGDISTGDNNDNIVNNNDKDNDGDLCVDREILCAINVGSGLRMCSTAPTMGGLRTRVPVNNCIACPLLQCGARCCYHCHPQSCLLLFVQSQCKQGGVWGRQQGSWGRMQLTTTLAEGNKVGEG
jgi:hypothetical protein